MLIDADTGQRIDMLAGRDAPAVTEWLRTHPGVRTVCLHGTTAERWAQVHGLLDQDVGLLECGRQLNLGLNTVKGYARASEPERLRRVPQYRPTLVEPHLDYLRRRRAEEPGVPLMQLLDEIRELGYPCRANLLHRYLSQGRADWDRAHLSPRHATRLLLTRPENLTDRQSERLDRFAASCPEMTALRGLIRNFAGLMKPDETNPARLETQIRTARSADLPHVHSFARGLQQDHEAVIAALTKSHHNDRIEGVNTRTKMLKRQMYGRAGFTLLRHRILLG